MKKHWRCVVIAATVFLGSELSGCANTKRFYSDIDVVHLHANTLSPRDRNAIREALVAEGFTVKTRENPSPFEENTLIYHPFIGVERQLERIRLALDSTEYVTENLQVRQAKNHHYTPGHVGLYLKAEHAETPSNEAALPEIPFNLTDAEFVSRGCESTYILEFYHDATATILAINGDAPLATLKWMDTEDKVTLSSDQITHRYQKHLDTRREGPDITFSISLRPESKTTSPYGCEYRGRMTAHRLNH
ncbi:hypothetical protein [Marinimicrobium locisalis]|uniref:hypothetical protein n=1 Tax=Marinimicrobium locisalis TaxID=546022 RepID=UPI0032215685